MMKSLALIGLTKLLFENPKVFVTVMRVWKDRLSMLGPTVLAELYESVAAVQRNAVPGIFIEAGCALGGSALVIAASRWQPRPFLVYDTFAGMPAPGERDAADVWAKYRQITTMQAAGIHGNPYYGYRTDLLQRVERAFTDYHMPIAGSRIQLVKGLFEDTLQVNEPVAFAHIDSDWHDSVMICLQRIEPQLAVGGRMVIDDYFYWSGCKRAVDDYFADKRDRFTFTACQRLHIIRDH